MGLGQREAIWDLLPLHHGSPWANLLSWLLVPFQAMAGAGIVSGFDMTSEAALAKLSYVLGQPGLSLNDRKKVGVPLGLGALPRAHEYLLTPERARRSVCVCVLEVEGEIGPVLTQFIQATP